MRKGHRRSPDEATSALAGAALERFLEAERCSRTDFATWAGLSPRHLRSACAGKSISWQSWDAILEAARARALSDVGRHLAEDIARSLETVAAADAGATPAAPPPASAAVPRKSRPGASVVVLLSLLVVGALVSWFALAGRKVAPAPSPSPAGNAPSLRVDGKVQNERAQGETFQLAARGLTPAGAVVRFEEPPRYPKADQAQSRIALEAGVDGTLLWAATVGCDIDERDYAVWLKDRATGRETNRVVLRVVTNPRCPAEGEGVDFVTAGVELDRAVARAGDSLRVAFTIRNQGQVAAPATEARVRLGLVQATNPHKDALLSRVEVPPLAPGDLFRSHVVVVVPSVAAGTYAVWVVADATSVTLEAASADNFGRSAALEVTGPR
ncbi:MAG: CARDB domain-containing protein [Vicinamibacteria bacterium]